MVIQQRTELFRNRILYFLSLSLAIVVLAGIIWQYLRTTPMVQGGFIVIALAAIAAIALALAQLYSFPKRSHALLIQREGDTIIATNVVHEGFKLRFLRDVLGENVFSFSDEDRERLKALETDNYYPAFL